MRGSVVSGGLCVALVSLSAKGRVQPYYSPVPISAEAIAIDPTLANYKSWDLRVAVSNGPTGSQDRFNVADWETPLTQGNFYSPVGGGDVPVQLTPATANLAYDTYVTVPGFVAGSDAIKVFILGSGDLSGPGSPTPIFPRANGQQSAFNVAWGTLGNPNYNGDFQIARFTVSNDATGPIYGYVGTLLLPNTPIFGQSLSFFNGMLLSAGGIPLAADANYDSRVNAADFTAVAQNFNKTSTGWTQGDFNGDGKTNALDFGAISTNFGTNAAAPASAFASLVPRPGMLALIAAPLVGMKRRRRR